MKRIVLLVIALVIGISLVQHLSAKQEAFTPDNLIRIHVVANSDSTFDQDLKIKVKDRLVNWLSPQLAESRSAEESRQILSDNIDVIQEVARQEVMANQGNYEANIMLGEYDFPTKTYGSITLPHGKYQALRVVLGEGTGANWWCVLFPPLCIGKDTPAVERGDPKWLLSTMSSNARKKLVSIR
ncbi:MAG: stage II sporulation protein R, partial [Syntrophomonadaceae bacterium]|nr:stage II sporulation protein R [Syntrophomonadaceae bacterium]